MLIIILGVIFLGLILWQYNSFIKRENLIKQAESTIDVYLMQRFDLIPNLVECVKGYTNYEANILEKIVNMRTNYMHTKNLKQGAELNNKCNEILLIGEQYPELKASEQFLNLQKNLTKMENQLQAARRVYNSEVMMYNVRVKTIPTNVIAILFRFKEKEFFELGDGKEVNIKI